MENTFELNKMDFFTVQHAEENEFLNEKLETDQYGIYYWVKFVGDADAYLWQAKSKPEEGQKYWGHLEKAKSGKSIKFKRDKEPEGQTTLPVVPANQKKDEQKYLRDISDIQVRIYNGSLNYAKDAGLNLITDFDDLQAYLDYVDNVSTILLRKIEIQRSGSQGDDKPSSPENDEANDNPKAPIHEKLDKGFTPKTRL